MSWPDAGLTWWRPGDHVAPITTRENELTELNDWNEFRGAIRDRDITYIGYEGIANHRYEFEPIRVPSLLQTPDYTRALVSGVVPRLTAQEIDLAVSCRAVRQQRVWRRPDPLRMSIVVGEPAFRYVVGDPDIMRAQIDHVRELDERDHVSVRVLTFDADVRFATSSGGVLLETAEADVFYVESWLRELIVDDEATIDEFRVAFAAIESQASELDDLFPREAP